MDLINAMQESVSESIVESVDEVVIQKGHQVQVTSMCIYMFFIIVNTEILRFYSNLRNCYVLLSVDTDLALTLRPTYHSHTKVI